MVNNRKDVDRLVSDLNICTDMIFYTYSLDRNKITALFCEDDNEYKHVDFSIEYEKDISLELRTRHENNDDFLSVITRVLKVVKSMDKLELNNSPIGYPDFYYNAFSEEIITTVFGWDLQKKLEIKKDIK